MTTGVPASGSATLNPAAGYRRALTDHLPNVTLVVDHFHAIRLANRAIDDVRRRVQQQSLGHRGRKGDPLYRIRRVLLTADDKLTEDRFAWMQAMLTRGDPDGEVAVAWIAKELLRDVYAAREMRLTPVGSWSASTRGAPTLMFESCDASPEPSAAGQNRSSPTTAPAAPPTVESRTPTCSPRRSAASATGSPTTTTIGVVSSAGSASNGILNPPHEYEAANDESSCRTLKHPKGSPIASMVEDRLVAVDDLGCRRSPPRCSATRSPPTDRSIRGLPRQPSR